VTSPRLRLIEAERHERPVSLRIPFRFGVTTLFAAPQAFLRVRIALEGGSQAIGVASELMVPKWFDKDARLSDADNYDQLRRALALTADSYAAHGFDTAFGLAMRTAQQIADAGAREGLPGLALGFGPALFDRALLDAACRAFGVSIFQAMTAGLPGFDRALQPADLRDFDLGRFAAGSRPPGAMAARHTIGMTDPLAVPEELEAEDDGLPRTLPDIIRAYGHTHFKVKVRGDLAEDLDRLIAIAAILDRSEAPYALTLDGNEQYGGVEQVEEFLAAVSAEPRLRRFNGSILFLEQPLARAMALDRDVAAIGRRLPVLIDESDADMDAFVRARARGYSGVSSKGCKGVYRSLVNAARCAAWKAEGGRPAFLSAEDLTCPSGLPVQQDLALAALVGVTHAERNGHHYIGGVPSAGEAERNEFFQAHPTLYERSDGQVRLKIRRGMIDLRSLDTPGFGSAALPALAEGVPLVRP
jgi:hypothetical protein